MSEAIEAQTASPVLPPAAPVVVKRGPGLGWTVFMLFWSVAVAATAAWWVDLRAQAAIYMANESRPPIAVIDEVSIARHMVDVEGVNNDFAIQGRIQAISRYLASEGYLVLDSRALRMAPEYLKVAPDARPPQ